MSKTASSAIEQFMALFPGYEHACGLFFSGKTAASGKAEGRFQTPTRSATREDYETHLKGTGPSLGLVPLLTDLTCHFGALDIDIKGQHALHEPVEKLEARVRKLELPLVFCLSKSGGAHLYLFGSEPLPAKLLRQKLAEFAKILGYPGCEVFPKQETRKPGDTGNWINLPYAGALSEQGTNRFCLRNGKPVKSLEDFVQYAEMMRINGAELQATQSQPTTATIDEGGRNNKLHKLACQLRGMGWPQDLIEDTLLNANQSLCDPPMSEKDVRGIARRGSKYEPNPVPDEDLLIYGPAQDPIAKRVDKIDQILRAMPEEQLYVTPISRRFVHVIEDVQLGEQSKVKRDPHTPVLVDVSVPYLRDVISRSGKVRRDANKQLIEGDPSREDAEGFLKRVETSPKKVQQRRLRMLSTSPILLDDNTIVCEPGYHEPSQTLIVARGFQFADPAPHKLELSAEECRAKFEEHLHPLFCLFPFAKEDPEQEWHETASFSVVLAAMMSIAARNLLPTVPGYGFDAPEKGSGKSFLASAISVAMTSVLPSAVTFDGPEEYGKVIVPLIAQGDRALFTDNVTKTVDGDKLATALTQEGKLRYRPLGTSTIREVENNSVLLFAGNNLRFTGDALRRFLKCRIEPNCERPELRPPFPFEPPKEALKRFPQLVMTVLRVMQSHALAGFPGRTKSKADWAVGSFGEWDKRVRWCLLNMGYADPIVTQDAIRQTDPFLEANQELVVMVCDAIKDSERTVREINARISPAERPRFMELTNHKPDEPFSELKVGQCFGRLRDRWFGGFRLVWGRTIDGRRKWRVEMRLEEVRNGGKRQSQEEEPL